MFLQRNRVSAVCSKCGSRNTKYDYTDWLDERVFYCYDCNEHFKIN